MCLIINIRKHPLLKPIKLRKDKIVWKKLDDDHVSLIRRFKYRRGKTYTDKGIFVVDTACRTGIEVTKAFHAFTSKICWSWQDKFVIPAGSLVYYGENGEICSDTIRFPRLNE